MFSSVIIALESHGFKYHPVPIYVSNSARYEIGPTISANIATDIDIDTKRHWPILIFNTKILNHGLDVD